MSKNYNTPTINKAKRSPQYKEGVIAYEAKLPRTDNPYEPRTYHYSEWDRGWFFLYRKGNMII